MQTSDLKNLTIAIVGAGYGGAAAAKALSLLGADVTVYEQAEPDPRGRRRHRPAPLDDGPVPPVGHLRRDQGRELGQRLLRDPHRHRTTRSPGRSGRRRTTTARPTHLIHRGDFIEALVGVLPDGHGQARPQARDASTTTATGSVLTFANGETADRRPGHRRRRHQVGGARAAVQPTSSRSSPASTPTAR